MSRPKKYATLEEAKIAQNKQIKAWRKSHQEYLKKYRESRREKNNELSRKYRKSNRDKAYARDKVYHALLRGELKKGFCEQCGASEVEAHHCDYNKPLDVMWLCRQHHLEWHEKNGAIEPRDKC